MGGGVWSAEGSAPRGGACSGGVPAPGGAWSGGSALGGVCSWGGACSGGCLLWGVLALGGACSWGVPAPGGSGRGVPGGDPPMATAADSTHPTGMHSCFFM